MYRSHEAIARHEESGRPCVPVHGLRELVLGFAGFAGEQHRVIQAVLLDEGSEPGGILQLLGLFE